MTVFQLDKKNLYMPCSWRRLKRSAVAPPVTGAEAKELAEEQKAAEQGDGDDYIEEGEAAPEGAARLRSPEVLPKPASVEEEAETVLYATCPKGHLAELSDHEVDELGYVTPSLVCPQDDCGFHDQVRLTGSPYRA